MKKVVERVQRENESLKKSAHQDRVAALEKENTRLKVSIISDILRINLIWTERLTLTNSRWLARFHHPPFIFLQADFESLKCQSEAELASKLEAKTRGLEKIVGENENLRKEIKRVTAIMLLFYYFFFVHSQKLKVPR